MLILEGCRGLLETDNLLKKLIAKPQNHNKFAPKLKTKKALIEKAFNLSTSESLFLLFNFYTSKCVLLCEVLSAGLLVGRGKKSQISRDFQGQIRGKNGRIRGNFAGIFEASFAKKRLVKNGRFRESFPSKFR